MPWEAPNLLDKIFREPEVADSQVFNNFMGGFLASRDRAAQAKPASGDDSEGGASGDAQAPAPASGGGFFSRLFGGGKSQPAASNTSASDESDSEDESDSGNGIPKDLSGTPAVDTSWVGNWMRSSLEGQQMGKNITAYQQAVTSTKTQQAQLVGDVLKNQETAKHIQDSSEDEQAISNALRDVDPHEVWNTPAPYLKTAEGRQGWAEMQSTSANTLLAKAKQEMQAKTTAEAARLLAEGYDVLNPQGQPDPEKMRVAGQALFERKRKLELDKQAAIGQRQSDIWSQRDADTAQRQLDNINARGGWNEKLLLEKQKNITDQSGKMLEKSYHAALTQELLSVRTDPTLTSAQKSQKMDDVIAKYGLKGKLDYSKIARPAPVSGTTNDPLGIRGNGR